jgi:translation initiation factor 3 subunit H
MLPATLRSPQTQEMIETFISYHDSIKKCVCIVYDPQRQQRGQVGLRAIRLKDSFIELFKEQKLTGAA